MKEQHFIPLVYFILSLFSHVCRAENVSQTLSIPQAINSVGGHGEAFSNGAMAALNDSSAIRLNPAMMTSLNSYQVNGVVHWPGNGRDYFQLGVVDPVTNPGFAAGVMVTMPLDKMPDPAQEQGRFADELRPGDDLATRRIHIGFAQSFAKLSLGISLAQIEGYEKSLGYWQKISGRGLGAGLAAMLTPSVRLGASVEGLSARKVANLFPKTKRAGLAILWADGMASTQLDYRERSRIAEEVTLGQLTPEKSIILSGAVTVWDIVKLIAAVGKTLEEKPSNFSSAGAAVMNQGFSLAWNISKNDLNVNNIHQALSLGLDVRM